MGRAGSVGAFAVAAMLALTPPSAGAATLEDVVAAKLTAEGYGRITVEHTWLGRIRIVGWLDGRMREIVLHPTSGEVLRDYVGPSVTQMASSENGDSGSPAAVGAATAAGSSAVSLSAAARQSGDNTGVAAAVALDVASVPQEPVAGFAAAGASEPLAP